MVEDSFITIKQDHKEVRSGPTDVVVDNAATSDDTPPTTQVFATEAVQSSPEPTRLQKM